VIPAVPALGGAGTATGASAAGARNVVNPAPSATLGRGAGAVTCRVTTFPAISVAVTVTFASSGGASEQPKTVQPPFSAKQSA
jgi:hypothetical protein